MANVTITGIVFASSDRILLVQLDESVAAFDFVQNVGGKFVASRADDIAKDKPTHMMLESGVVDDFKTAVELKGKLALTTSSPLVQATQYVLSRTSGKTAPRGDLANPDVLTNLYLADASLLADIGIDATKIVIPI